MEHVLISLKSSKTYLTNPYFNLNEFSLNIALTLTHAGLKVFRA